MTALITPFRQGAIDVPALQKLVEFQIEQGTQVLVPCGTTGESATLSMAEHHQAIQITVQAAKKRVWVMAGTGSNNTQEAIALTQAAKEMGADCSLSIVPYYNKPTQEGIIQHYLAIAKATRFPFVLYNIQSRTGINVLPETIARLAELCPELIGVKEASGNLEQISRLHAVLPERVSILSGDDALTLPIMAIGGSGVISVVGNIFPRAVADLTSRCLENRYPEALRLHEALLPVVQALFTETNPIPVKAIMAERGWCTDEVRLPLVSATPGAREKLRLACRTFEAAFAGTAA
jgi:4-hydroxy-tetrahydrodipicolinate synthase